MQWNAIGFKENTMASKTFYLTNFVILLSTGNVALASLAGPYIFLGGGGAYYQGGQLSSTTISEHDSGPVRHYSISYNQRDAINYTFRAEGGYYFNKNPLAKRAFGLGLGTSYFGLRTSSTGNTLEQQFNPNLFPVSTMQSTWAWSSDLTGLLSRALSSQTNLIFKLGIAFEYISSNITNAVQNFPNQLPEEDSLHHFGAGGIAGIGLQTSIFKKIAFRVEINVMKGSSNIGYMQALVGLNFSIK